LLWITNSPFLGRYDPPQTLTHRLEDRAILSTVILEVVEIRFCVDWQSFVTLGILLWLIEPRDVVRPSVARIKDSFWFYFSELV